jgi:ornithine carbamoyltransferase
VNSSAPAAGKVRHLLNLSDLGPGGLRRVLDHARARKQARRGLPQGAPDGDAPLSGHVLASLFEKPSTRTRLSFEIAMRQLGGSALTLSAADLQLGRGETIEDTARVFSGFVDAVMIRANRHTDVETFAAHATIPVLNGLTDHQPPLPDRRRPADSGRACRPQGRRHDWAWVGDGNNVLNSIIEAAGLLGFAVKAACPVGHEPDAGFVAASPRARREHRHRARTRNGCCERRCRRHRHLAFDGPVR